MLTTLFLIQAAVPSEAPRPSLVPRCTIADPDEIVVCGTRDNRKYRLDPLPDQPPPKRIKTYLTLAPGVTIGFGGEQGSVGGIPTNRGMLTLKIKF